MTLEEIKAAVDAGKKVHWANKAYDVVKSRDSYHIVCNLNGHTIHLTWIDGTTMNGKPEEFFIEPTWQVIVGNIGLVHEGQSERIALEEYEKACEMPWARGRDESVTLFCDGEIIKEKEHE